MKRDKAVFTACAGLPRSAARRLYVPLAPLLGLLLGVLTALSPAPAAAIGTTPSPTAGCAGAWSGMNTVQPVLVIDCRPGFASKHDRISIYSRQPIRPDVNWQDGLNQSDAVWIFDSGATGRASLVVDFHPDRPGPGVVADLYDDQNGDGQVTIAYRDGIPYAAESPYPTVRVRAPAGWWTRDGTVNFNLDLTVDGPVEAAFNSNAYLQRLKTDGQPDFAITVRDTHAQGRPDFELINAWPGAPEDWGIDRSQLMVDTAGNEAPISNSIFWPYLGTSFDLPASVTAKPGNSPPSSVHAPNGQPYGFVKDYGQSFPPIQVYWPAAKVAYVGEFVASRGNSANWFVYSISRLSAGQSYANFENPFAFYDLANVDDGYPDLQIRDEYYGPDDRFLGQGEQRTASDLIRYSWDQFHRHKWDFKVDLLGRNAVDSTVSLPGLDVRTIPYASYPRWVVDHTWDAADFVAIETPNYWTSEGIYESLGVNTQLRDTYLTGRQSSPPQLDAESWPVGFRGEYSDSFHDQPWLYLSAVDHKLHLLNAQAGLWKLDGAREIRYTNLGGSFLNEWSLVENRSVTKVLTLVGSQLILADPDGVRIKSINLQPALLTMLPPTNHDNWVQLRAELEANQPSFTPDDFRAMFDQFPGVAQVVPGASLSDLRPSPVGLTFSLRLAAAQPRGPTWLSGLQPGGYRVTYDARSGYSTESLRLVLPSLSPIDLVGQPPTAFQPIVVETTVRNPGNEDRTDFVIRFTATDDGRVEHNLGTVALNVPAGGSALARVTWTPPTAGNWVVRVASDNGGAVTDSAEVKVTVASGGDLANLLTASGLDGSGGLLAGAILGTAVLLAGCLAVPLWRASQAAYRESVDPESEPDNG